MLYEYDSKSKPSVAYCSTWITFLYFQAMCVSNKWPFILNTTQGLPFSNAKRTKRWTIQTFPQRQMSICGEHIKSGFSNITHCV